MRLFFIPTMNITANNDDLDCNVKKTKESSLFQASSATYSVSIIIYFAFFIVIFTSSTSSSSSSSCSENKTKESGLLPAPSVTLQEKRNSKSLPLLSHSSKLLKHDYFSKTSCIQNKTQEKEIMNFVHLAGQNLSVAISGISVVAKFASHFAHFDHFSGSPSNLCRKVGWAI